MPLAVTHIAPAVFLFNFLKKKLNIEKYAGSHAVFIASIGALLPDFDIFLGRVLKIFGYDLVHGTYLHTPFFALFFFLPALVFLLLKNYRFALYFSLLGFGIILHVFLDYLIGGGAEAGVMWFFPLSSVAYKIHLLSSLSFSLWPQELDAVVLLAWIWLKKSSFR